MSGPDPDLAPGQDAAAGPAAAELVARARALQPLLREHAAKADADRRMAAECIDALGEAGLFKVSVPKRYGGYASTLRAMLDVSAAVAEGDGSAGWIVALVNVCNWLTALFPEQAQREVFADPAPRVTGVLTPSADTRKVDGGWRVSGRWYFNSGSWWSTWAVLGVPLTGDDGAAIDQGLVLVPAADLTVEDVWHVTGMRGTASNCLVASDVFVPSHRVMPVPAAIEGHYPTPFADEPLFRSSFVPVLTLVLAGPQLGMGRAALDLVTGKAAKKPIAYTFFETQAESVAFQLQVADAATKVDVATLLCHRAAADIDEAAARGEYLDYRTRARVRADAAYAAQSVVEALTTLMNAHGASGFADSSPLQRIWRDANVAARHAVISPAVGAEVYGKALLGVEEKITPLV
jgi:alkylation response protein AidB-like acyl-CoA dehydrogenase